MLTNSNKDDKLMRYTYPRVIEVGGGSGSSPMKL